MSLSGGLSGTNGTRSVLYLTVAGDANKLQSDLQIVDHGTILIEFSEETEKRNISEELTDFTNGFIQTGITAVWEYLLLTTLVNLQIGLYSYYSLPGSLFIIQLFVFPYKD